MVQEKAFQIKIEPKMNRQTSGLLESLGKTGASALGGIGKFAGIAGIAAIIASLKVFQPVINIAKNILNMLGQFLQPIADVVILLLQPILQILKPILIIVRQIMAPFRQLAFSLSRQAGQALQAGNKAEATGLFGLSIAAIGTGISAVFAFFSKEIIKSFLDGLGEIFKVIFPFFAEKIDLGVKLGKDAIDFGVTSLITAQSFAIAKAAQAFGADVSTEFGNIVDLMNTLFIGEDNSFKSVFDTMTNVMQNSIQPELETATGNFLGALDSFIIGINNRASQINGGGTVASATRRARDNIFKRGLITSLPLL